MQHFQTVLSLPFTLTSSCIAAGLALPLFCVYDILQPNPWPLEVSYRHADSLMTFPGNWRGSCPSAWSQISSYQLSQSDRQQRSWTQSWFSDVRATDVGSQGGGEGGPLKSGQGSQIPMLSQQNRRHRVFFPTDWYFIHLYISLSLLHGIKLIDLAKISVPFLSLSSILLVPSPSSFLPLPVWPSAGRSPPYDLGPTQAFFLLKGEFFLATVWL